VKLTSAGNAQYGASREGTHDDLVLAVALPCWGARKVHPWGPYGTGCIAGGRIREIGWKRN
jgi:hypothetical protein